MSKSRSIILTLFLLALGACGSPREVEQTEAPSTPASPDEARVLISEVMAGAEGNNNFEFVELFNSGGEMLDLRGWSLWYRLASSEEDLPVHVWEESAFIPPHGHYLLGREGEDLGILPDGTFRQGLNTNGGGLELRGPDGQAADALVWGKGPAEFAEGGQAPALVNGSSLERNPGGDRGNQDDTDDNAADFSLLKSPRPQNSGSPLTPRGEESLEVQFQAPASVEPGSSFEYDLTVVNRQEEQVTGVVVTFSLPAELQLTSLPADVTMTEDGLEWRLGDLGAHGERTLTLETSAPWAYLSMLVNGYYAWADDLEAPFFGGPVWTRVEGGMMPINIARGLIGSEVTVEGVATMYTGGYFAGSGNVKFYLEDAQAGIQVYVPGGDGKLEVPVGARLRVRGVITLYRGSTELIPGSPEDIEFLDQVEPPTPLEVSLRQATFDTETLPGRLIVVTGMVSRVEEFSYSYEVDLVDQDGNLLTLYLDKLTEMSAEPIEAGHEYQAIGIMEVRDGFLLLYPRRQSDLQEVYPPELMVEAMAPSSVLPNEVFTVSVTIFNHTDESLGDILIQSPIPVVGASLDQVLDGGEVGGEQISWNVNLLPGGGASVTVRFQARAQAGFEVYVNAGIIATTPDWPGTATGETLRVFIGEGVPIWAIQGEGLISPYKLRQVSSTGVVTGVFPEMGGFWIQEIDSDDDPATSAGLFISSGDIQPGVSLGNLVRIEGQVREVSRQTQIEITEPEAIQVLASGVILPEAVPLDPPPDEALAAGYYEALEGMLVSVLEPALAVSPTSKYGEYALVLAYHGLERVWRGDPSGELIIVDDGSAIVHYDRSALPYTVTSGDIVSGLTGPLAFTYGQYKIEPTTLPEIQSRPQQLAQLSMIGSDEFSVMSWNVENLFDILDPHPSSPPRPRKAAYELDLTRVANTILAAGAPTIVGLQEVETLKILQDLSNHEALLDYRYQAYLLEGTDSRGIDVGYLVRADRATVLTVEQVLAPEGLTSRPPLLLVVELESGSGPVKLTLLNNHFTSMAGGEAATEPRRTAQAAWNGSIVESLLAEDPLGYVAVIGDLNSFYDSRPIDTLRETGLEHVFDVLPKEDRYTYIYQGVSQSLDHILVTPSLMAVLRKVVILRLDADHPPPLAGDPSPLHKSDHDPVLAIFSLSP